MNVIPHSSIVFYFSIKNISYITKTIKTILQYIQNMNLYKKKNCILGH